MSLSMPTSFQAAALALAVDTALALAQAPVHAQPADKEKCFGVALKGKTPELGATLASLGEHVLPLMLLLGLGTRFAALGLLVMTAVIQLLVYPAADPTHGVWAAVLLWLMVRGPGAVSIGHALAVRRNRSTAG